jgi:hypothetical protein
MVLLVAKLQQPLDPGIQQFQVQPEAGGDLWVEHAVEVAAEQPIGVQRQAVHQRQVGQVGVGLVRRALALARLPVVPVMQIEAYQQRLGEPTLQIRPVPNEPVVEVPARLHRRR